MKHKKWMLVTLIIAVFIASFSLAPQAQASPPFDACWGQASAVYAKLGYMGEHSSQQEEPRDGLYNLAVYLYNDGIIDEPSLAALGAFVAEAEGLSIDACIQ